MSNETKPPSPGPFVEMSRSAWAALAAEENLPIDVETLKRVRGLGDPTNMTDVAEVYRPLCELLHLYYDNSQSLRAASNDFMRLHVERTPFVIGVAGSVAVGKSTTSRLLQALLAQDEKHPRVDLVTTDGFLYPNAELERRGLMGRKGFPESYDRKALLRFVIDVKSGVRRVSAPVYSHMVYDVVPDERIIIDGPDILIVEGLNVLQPSRRRADGTQGLAVSDFFDFTVYVDASDACIRTWYLERFMKLRATAFQDPTSFFQRYAQMDDDEAYEFATMVWDTINGPNLHHNIRPTRGRADAILRKGRDHQVQGVRIRKI